jgi:hypothetical protein
MWEICLIIVQSLGQLQLENCCCLIYYFFRSDMKQGSAFCVFLHSHARSVIIGNTLPC